MGRRKDGWRRGHAARVTLALGVAVAGCSEPANPPNLLLITVDTLRADRLECYGGPPGVGRAICALGEHGTRFQWAIAAAPYTAPSIASILTSQYPATHGVTQSAVSYLRKSAITLAETLGAAGYTTAAFISNPVIDRSRSLDQGFDVFDQRMRQRERNRPRHVERKAQATADSALAWAQVGVREPWFIWVHFQDPHGPYDAPGAAQTADPPNALRLKVNSSHSGNRGIPQYQVLPGLFTPPAYEARYLDEIRYLDPHVESLVRGLDALGQPPAVLLTSDHGEAFGEDEFYFAHGHSVGLDQIRVPLLWRPSRPREGNVVTHPVSLLDVAPTLLRVAGLEAPTAFQGRPLPLAETGVAHEGERPIFSEHVHRLAVISGDTYYARDRRTFDNDERDSISGGRIRPLPRRSARLRQEGPLPDYVVEEVAVLEKTLAEYLDDTRFHQGARRTDLPRGTREALSVLGYLE